VGVLEYVWVLEGVGELLPVQVYVAVDVLEGVDVKVVVDVEVGVAVMVRVKVKVGVVNALVMVGLTANLREQPPATIKTAKGVPTANRTHKRQDFMLPSFRKPLSWIERWIIKPQTAPRERCLIYLKSYQK
jgi:hypothetical protein